MGLRSKLARLALVTLIAAAAHAQARHYRALVIGNGNYPQKPLRWAIADAREVAGRLTELGYEVTTLQNTTSQQLSGALGQLKRSIRAGDVVLVYYAGRATRARDVSSLVPIDDTGRSRTAAGVALASATDMLEYSRSAANVVVMDVAAEWPVFGVDISKEWSGAIPAPTARTMIVSGNGQGAGAAAPKLIQALQRPAESLAGIYAELGGTHYVWKGPRIPRAPQQPAPEVPTGSEAQPPEPPSAPQQPASTPRPTDRRPAQPPPVAPSDVPPPAPQQPAATPPTERRPAQPPPARFATIQAPARVAVGVPFAVLISLTAERRTPEVEISQVGPGTAKTAEGAIDPGLPCQTKCEVEVVLAGPGFDFGSRSNTVKVEMIAGGDSTPARFNLRALHPGEGKLEATFWYQGAFLARAARAIQIVSQQEAKPAAVAASGW